MKGSLTLFTILFSVIRISVGSAPTNAYEALPEYTEIVEKPRSEKHFDYARSQITHPYDYPPTLTDQITSNKNMLIGMRRYRQETAKSFATALALFLTEYCKDHVNKQASLTAVECLEKGLQKFVVIQKGIDIDYQFRNTDTYAGENFILLRAYDNQNRSHPIHQYLADMLIGIEKEHSSFPPIPETTYSSWLFYAAEFTQDLVRWNVGQGFWMGRSLSTLTVSESIKNMIEKKYGYSIPYWPFGGYNVWAFIDFQTQHQESFLYQSHYPQSDTIVYLSYNNLRLPVWIVYCEDRKCSSPYTPLVFKDFPLVTYVSLLDEENAIEEYTFEDIIDSIVSKIEYFDMTRLLAN